VLLRLGAPAVLDRALRTLESPKCWVPASVAIFAAFLAFLLLNTAFPGYVDHLEPTIASVSWLVLKGAPLYHGLDSPDRYTLLYGPTSYLPFAGALWVGGSTVWSLKVLVLLADLAIVYFLGLTYRTVLSRRASLLVLSLVLVYMFVPHPNTYLFQIRGDVLIVCSVAVGLYAVSSESRWAGPLLLSLAAAFAVDAKFTAFLYLIPLYARLNARRGWRVVLGSVVVALGLSALPFLLPNVSLRLYLTWVYEGLRHPRSIGDLMSTVRTFAVLALPPLLIAGYRPWKSPATLEHLRQNRGPLLALASCLLLVVLLSSKLGAGPHHLLPFVPVLGYECALLWVATRAPWSAQRHMLFRYCWGCIATFAVVRASSGLAETSWMCLANWASSRAVTADVQAILNRSGGRRIEMGYGEREDSVTFFRPPLVFADDHLTVDDQALNDMQLADIQIPEATVDELVACTTEQWLIPKGEEPFALVNHYNVLAPELFPARPLFTPAFREAFTRVYRRGGSTEFFDLWVCDRAGAQHSPAQPSYAVGSGRMPGGGTLVSATRRRRERRGTLARKNAGHGAAARSTLGRRVRGYAAAWSTLERGVDDARGESEACAHIRRVSSDSR
jgi:hypothetical protein